MAGFSGHCEHCGRYGRWYDFEYLDSAQSTRIGWCTLRCYREYYYLDEPYYDQDAMEHASWVDKEAQRKVDESYSDD